MKIYDPDIAKEIPLAKALKKMTLDWVADGNCCAQTTADFIAACAQLLKENRKLKRDVKAANAICEYIGYGIEHGSVVIDKTKLPKALSNP